MKKIPVVILCGGKGARLLPLTRNCPKPLVPVAGVPFIFHQFSILRDQGFTDVILLVSWFWRKFIKVHPPPGMKMRIIRDYPHPLGSGGAIRSAIDQLPEEFFTLYGDSYLPVDYAPVYEAIKESGKLACMSAWQGVDYGINCFKKEAFDGFTGVFDLPVVFDGLKKKDQLAVLEMPEPFKQIGTPEGLAEVEKLLRK